MPSLQCPDCGRAFDGVECTSCDYTAPPPASKPAKRRGSKGSPTQLPPDRGFMNPTGLTAAQMARNRAGFAAAKAIVSQAPDPDRPARARDEFGDVVDVETEAV